MSAVASNGYFASRENISQVGPKSSPASPLLQSTPQMTARSLMNKRGQNSPFPLTPTISQQSILEPPAGVQYIDFVKTWTDDHVAQWLADVKCGNLAGLFRANDIRGDIILELDQVTLKEMGVTSVGEKLRIVNAVKILRQKVSTRTVGTPGIDRAKPPPYTVEARSPQPNQLVTEPTRTETAPLSRLARSVRPAPLQLNPNASKAEQLPRIEPVSAHSQTTVAPPPRPLPNPAQQPGSTASTPNLPHRTNLPPLPPPPTTKPPPPPPPGRPTNRPSNSNLNGRRTPTQGELMSSSYVSQNSTPNRDLLTPSPAGGWSGYHLPSDPRPGNSGGSKLAPPRATSPLPPGRVRPSASNSNLSHARNTSLGVNTPSRGSSVAQQLPPRPSTGNSHPYANAQPSIQQNLSPIAESFLTQRTNNQGTPSPPNAGVFPGGRPNAQPEAFKHKLVKFRLPDGGVPSSITIDVATCSGGVEILEKVLRKFGKTSGRAISDNPKMIEMEDGGLNIDGWCVCLGMGQQNGPGTPLREAELMSICNAPTDSPTREHELIVRRVIINRRYDDRGEGSSQAASKSLLQTSKSNKRASSISVLSGLGVRDPEKALDPPSPTSNAPPKNTQDAKRPSKLRNFFGQRPPSELITTHLAEYFPAIEKKVLERTARQSVMMRGNPLNRRESGISVTNVPRSRFSSSTMGSSGSRNRVSMAPSARSSSPNRAPSTISNNSLAVPGQDDEPAPRVSLSTDDGREIDLNGKDEEPITPSRATAPQLLPPINTDSSFSSSFDDLTKMTQPAANKRMSYMTELRSKRDNSDAASFMTVDEITAEVESRRASLDPGDRDNDNDNDDSWTKVESDTTSTAVDSTLESLTTTLEAPEDDSDEEDEPVFNLGGGNKWIKGALIGAGSFGKVYLGMDASNGMLMAVKQVELPTGSGPNQDKKKSMLNALEREIELLKNLQHPNIVQYLYSSVDEEFLNIFLEYVPGGSVAALLRNYGAFEEPLVKNFVRQILQGLSYLHEKEIIHRDIKGGNILVDNKGGIKISDFGISKKVDDNLLTGNRVNRPSLQGSVFWMAPEVVKQSAHTQKADIWSVGCLVVEMLTGEHPWAQLTQMQAIFKIGSSAKPTIPSDISAEAQDFLRLTFEINHEARPSAAQLMQHAWMQKKKKDTSKTAAS